MNKYFILLFIVLITAIVSCNKPPGVTTSASSRFHADSVAIIAKANQFRLEKEYDSAIALLDSAFLLPIQSNQHPDGLSPDDARRLLS